MSAACRHYRDTHPTAHTVHCQLGGARVTRANCDRCGDGAKVAVYFPPKRTGLGDMVSAVAQPIARAIDAVAGTDLQNCGGCKQRREALNQKFRVEG